MIEGGVTIGRIEVYDVGEAKSNGKKLQSLGQNLISFEDRIKNLCTQLKEDWPSDTQDAISYLEGIENNTNRLSKIAEGAISAGRAFECNAVAQEEELMKLEIIIMNY